MRLLFITSGRTSLSHLDPNMIDAFRQLSQEMGRFQCDVFHYKAEPLKRLTEKVRCTRPDVILVSRGYWLPSSIVSHLRTFGIPLGLWVVDDPYNIRIHERLAQPYHFVVTQEASCLSHYRQKNKRCLYLPLAVNPKKYAPARVSAKYRSDVCFVGSGLPERIRVIDRLAPFLLQKKFILIGRWWERLTRYEQLKRHIVNHPIAPREAAYYYNGAKIVLNIHRTDNDVGDNPTRIPSFTPNNRTFDIAACQAFQLVSHRRHLNRFYELEKEIVSFKNLPELKRKIDYYLAHDDARETIAARAYGRTIAEHTYVERLRPFVGALERIFVTNSNGSTKADR